MSNECSGCGKAVPDEPPMEISVETEWDFRGYSILTEMDSVGSHSLTAYYCFECVVECRPAPTVDVTLS